MTEQILTSLNEPGQLELLYRTNKVQFKQAFTRLYPGIKGNPLAECWYERLSYDNNEIKWGAGREMAFVIIASIVAGIIAKLPMFLNIDPEFFYTRNVGFILFPALCAYFAWMNRLTIGKIAFIVSTTLAGLIFINAFPKVSSDTLLLSSLHLILVLWSLLGLAFTGKNRNNVSRRLKYLKFNGDLVVITTLIVIAGGIMSGVTIGLFTLIGLNIEKFYFEYVVVFGLPAAPIFGTWLTQNNPQLVGKVSPVIARIFSPLVLVMLLIYLGAIVYSGKDPYNDREFLLMFNALLIGVMAIIFFSVAGTSKLERSSLQTWVLSMLSIVTIVVNGIALSAIVFRISEWGITPNRAAVLGGNLVILIHLLQVTVQLIRMLISNNGLASVDRSIARYLPVYCIWAMIVTFLFPFLFGFK